MSKAVYINRHDSGRSGGGGLRRILAVLLIVVLMAVALVLFFVQKQNKEADSVMERFEAALEAGEYETVLDIHTQAQERSLSKSQSEKNQGIYAESLIEMENKLFGRIDSITAKLLASEQATLTADDLEYLTGLEEFSGSKLSEMISSLGLRVLSGEMSSSRARRILTQLADVEMVADEAAAMRGELAALDEAAELYQAAMKLFENESYIAAATALDTALSSPEVKADTLAARLFASELVRVRQTMRPILIEQLESLMERHRYISAERLMDDLLKFFPDDNEIIVLYEEIRQNVPTDLVQYSGTLEHLTLRPLIVNTKLGFGETDVAKTADSTMISSHEFKKILEVLHASDYVLIDIESLLNEQGNFEPIYLPPGKKPLLLTLEGYNYYPARRLSGNVENLVVDENGDVAGVYTNEAGMRVTEQESEAIGILDAFVERNPDFSFDGAKGTITLTGNMGIFGYVTNDEQLLNRNVQAAAFGLVGESYTAAEMLQQKSEAQAVVDALKYNGWTFGSQTYSGSELTAMSLEQVQQDIAAWKESIGSLVGEVSVLAFPNGALLSADDQKTVYLKEEGMKFFLGIGPTPYAVAAQNYLYMDRLYVGGYAIRNNITARLFESAAVYDPARTIPLSQ